MDAESQLSIAKSLREKGRHAEALEIAQTVAAFYPENADAWWVVGLAANALQKRPEALAALKTTIKLAPRWAPGWAQYGVVLAQNEQNEEAKKALYQSLHISHDYAYAHRQLAAMFGSEKNWDNQILHLSQLDLLGEANSHELNVLGIAYWHKKQYIKAIDPYLRSASLGTTANPYFNLSLIYSHPEVSQNLDAADALRRAIAMTSDYDSAIKQLAILTPKLSALAQDASKEGDTFLDRNEYFQFYINPFELLGFDRIHAFNETETKVIQKRKKAVLQEIDIEEGRVDGLDGCAIDKSRAIQIIDELSNPNLKAYHWEVFQNPFLLWFLTRGDIRHFLYSENSFPLELLQALDNNKFRKWLSEPFGKQYDVVLSKAIEKRAVRVIESLLSGRRWVLPEHDDICFTAAHRQIDRILEPLQNAARKAENTEPNAQVIEILLADSRLVDIMNLLPVYFRDQQSQTLRSIRDMAIAAYNLYDNSELSREILNLSKRFSLKSGELAQRLEDDFRKINELIQQERKHEAKLLLGGKPMEVTKDGVRQGDLFFPVASIQSVRWGITKTGYQNAPIHDYLLAFRHQDSNTITFSWVASTNIEQSDKHFDDLLQATFAYLVPPLVESVKLRIKNGGLVKVGKCTMKKEGVSFETPGWFAQKFFLIPWARVVIEIKNGQLKVADRFDSSKSITMPSIEAENMVVLRILTQPQK